MIVAHGNQSGDNSRTERQAQGLRDAIGLPVFCAYRRYSNDRIKAVMTRMAEQGLKDVLIIPMFMSANMYSDSIPRAMGLRDAGPCGIFEEGGRELRYRITTTLGDWEGSADLVADMADQYGDSGILLVCGCSDKGEPARWSGEAWRSSRPVDTTSNSVLTPRTRNRERRRSRGCA